MMKAKFQLLFTYSLEFVVLPRVMAVIMITMMANDDGYLFKGQNNKDDACRRKTGAGQDLFMNPLEIRSRSTGTGMSGSHYVYVC